MVCDAAVLDAFATHELAAGVVEHFIRVDVAVVVGSRHRLRVKIVGTRTKGTDDEAVALEGLVNRGRLMHPADNGLEVLDVEGPGIEHAVPAHHIAGMMVEDVFVEPVVLLDHHPELAALVVGLELPRPTEVALAVGRPLHNLAVLVAIAPGGPHVAPALEDQQPVRLGVQLIAMQDAAVDDEVISLAVGQLAELGLEGAAALAHIHHLIRLGIAVEMRIGLVGAREQHGDVAIEEERDAIEGRAAALRERRGAKMAMAQGPVGIGLPDQIAQPLDGEHRRGWMHVIQQRGGARESLVPHQLLGVEPAVRLAEGDVPLAGDLAEAVVDGHGLEVRGCHGQPVLSRLPRTAP